MTNMFSVGDKSPRSEGELSDMSVSLSDLLFGLITPASSAHTVAPGVWGAPTWSEPAKNKIK